MRWKAKKPYDQIREHQKLSNYLGVPIHALVTNDRSQVSFSFFSNSAPRPYTEVRSGGNVERGRKGVDLAFEMEQTWLKHAGSPLWQLVLPL